MKRFSQPKPGFELDWLAVDANDHVAIFSAAGRGPIPRIVAERLSDVEKAIERLTSLPVVGECFECPTGQDDYSFWIEPARRGIFSYDWGGTDLPPYARVTTPSRPVTIPEIDDDVVREAALLVRLPIDFTSSRAVDDSQLGHLEWNCLQDNSPISYGDPAHLHAATAIGSSYSASYDAAGNMGCRAPTSATTCTGTATGAQLTYDNQGQLAAWQNTPSNPTSADGFLYDNQGKRVEQQGAQSGWRRRILGNGRHRTCANFCSGYPGLSNEQAVVRIRLQGGIKAAQRAGILKPAEVGYEVTNWLGFNQIAEYEIAEMIGEEP